MRRPRPWHVGAGAAAAAAAALAAGAGGQAPDPILSAAVIYSSLLVLLAIGLTLTYMTTRVPNFAHASSATIGVYAALVVSRVWEASPYLSIPLAFAVAGATSLTLYTLVLRPLIRKRASQAIQMISTLAFDLVLIAALNIAADHIVRAYQVTAREFTLRSYDAQVGDLPAVLFVAPVAIAGIVVTLHLVLKRTRFGIAMRATIENPDLSSVVGINVRRVYGVSWFLGGGLAGVAGALMSLWFQGDPGLGALLIPSIFAASIVGGFMSIYGAIAGGALVGLAEILGTRWLAGELGSWVIAYRPLVPLAFIAATLMLAPRGLAGVDWRALGRRLHVARA
ncbi:MAG: branched-chain amino acid ABC transporter permease [Thaumarchaeota archaeon]|nr:branched-chain amino acid ABC transporter permease [Nitrososphaerota archaeon]MDD9813227.1 branched-chain amino acid ABC transporter permease [Nitrososphaerota archaeon]MDD9826570.1 branched-chain amino acid ABC transporter permease [Nitrososphaerota archaeon]MDD9843415.1 branched-chain amino acid ABC transporter permease [Nitrososphaerota archaeon]RNJ73952.1 MAG: branched-chain amino acid ABC transporter permease [Thaumarchaeota archaeon S13]